MIKSEKSVSCTNWLVHLIAYEMAISNSDEGRVLQSLFSLWKKPSSGTLLFPL